MKEFNVSLHLIWHPKRIDTAAVLENFVTIFRYFISKINAVIQNL